MAVLRQGASGPEVADLQRRLAALGYSPGPVDGVYGPQTVAAVKRYQQSAGIAVDGVAGPQTAAALAGQGSPAGAPSPNPLAPENDPQFLAYQRALGANEEDLRGTTAMQVGRTQRDLALRLPVLAEQARQAAQNIDNGYETRGLHADNGNLQLDQARSTQEFARQRGEAELASADRQADLQTDLARQLAQNRQNEAEQALEASRRRAEARAQLGLT